MFPIINPMDITDFNRTKEEKEIFIIFAMCVAGKEANQIAMKVMDLLYNPIIKEYEKEKSLYETFKKIKENKKIESKEVYNVIKKDTIKIKNEGLSPFEILRVYKNNKTIDKELKKVSMGKYTLLKKAFEYIVDNDFSVLENKKEPQYYEDIPGISLKSSRFYLLHTFENIECAALDTHILNFLKNNNVNNVPLKGTPNNKKLYYELEEEFINIYKEIKNTKDIKILSEENKKIFDKYKNKIKNNFTISDFDFIIWKESKKNQ